MTHRTRRELYDFLCLVFETKPQGRGPYVSLDALAAAAGARREIVERLVEIGLIRSGHGAPEPHWSTDEVRVAALAARLVELGAEGDDLVTLAEAMDANCEFCRHAPCPTYCDTLVEVRDLLARLGNVTWAGAGGAKRALKIAQAIRSIDALQDLA